MKKITSENVVTDFLYDFPWYRWKLIPDALAKTDIRNAHVNKPFEEAFFLNEQNASALYFTPNGWYDKENIIWKPINLVNKVNKDWIINSFILDLPSDSFSNVDDVKKTIEKYLNIQWRYIVRVPTWYQVYFVLQKWIWDILIRKYWSQLFKMRDLIYRIMNISRRPSRMNDVCYLPWSKVISALWKFDITLEDTNDSYVTLQQVIALMDFYSKYKLARVAEWLFLKTIDIQDYCKFDNELYYKELEQYITKHYSWEFEGKLNLPAPKIWDDIYKIPLRTSLYSYLWCLVEWADWAIRNILKDTFWLWEWALVQLSWDIHQLFAWDWYEIRMMDKMVQLVCQDVNNKWEIHTKVKILFRNNIKVTWKWKTSVAKMWEWDDSINVFIFECKWVEYIVKQFTTKKEFNKQFPSLFFYWNDDDLWLFFHALSEDNSIPDINIYVRSWYYDDICILWDRCIVWDIDNNRILLWNNAFSLVEDEIRQVSIQEYFDKFKSCYNEEFSVPVFMSAIALAWMNLRWMLEVNPAMLIAWKTGCWKSTVAALLKRMLWYWYSVREMALPWVTPQPLKQTAWDNAILFLEELTKKVWTSTEELLRNIVNRDKAARGMLDWNVWFEFRSPIWVNWERTFKDESLNNRFCAFIMSQAYWKQDAQPIINELMWMTAYQEIYETYVNNRDLVETLVFKYREVLSWYWYQGRTCDVWNYILVVNELFWLGYSVDELVWYIDKHLHNIWIWIKKEVDYVLQFERFLAVNMINWKISLTLQDLYKQGENWKEPRLIFNILFVDDAIYQTSRWTLNSFISEVNWMFDVDLFDIDETGITWYMLDKKANGKYTRDCDEYIHDMFVRIIGLLPSKVTSWNSSLMRLWDF